MMEPILKALDQTTLADAQSVLRVRFGESTCAHAAKMLLNPFVELCHGAGDVVYEDDVPVGVQCAIIRRLCFDGRCFFGVVGAMLAMKEGASPVSLYKLMRATLVPRAGSRLFFANTAMPSSMKLNRMLGVKGAGPESMARVRFAVLRPGGVCCLLLHKKMPRFVGRMIDVLAWPMTYLKYGRGETLRGVRRIKMLEAPDIMSLWDRYLTSFSGLVASRTYEELNWMFGDGLKSGRHIMLGYYNDKQMQGYIIFKQQGSTLRWKVADVLAINNDKKIIARLFKSMVDYLWQKTNACLVELIGLPDAYQKTIARILPFRRKLKNNTFLYKFMDPELEAQWKLKGYENWFFGPYDGDQCL